LFKAPGTPPSVCAPCKGAERRETRGARAARTPGGWRGSPTRLRRRIASAATEARLLGAPRRLYCPRGRSFRARMGGLQVPPIHAAFAALHPRRIQPSKAAPLSGGGWRPEASRERGSRAPPADAASGPAVMTPHESSLGELGLLNIFLDKGGIATGTINSRSVAFGTCHLTNGKAACTASRAERRQGRRGMPRSRGHQARLRARGTRRRRPRLRARRAHAGRRFGRAE
jgi:hypothetical protein